MGWGMWTFAEVAGNVDKESPSSVNGGYLCVQEADQRQVDVIKELIYKRELESILNTHGGGGRC